MNFSSIVQWLLYSSATASILIMLILLVKRLGKNILGYKGQYYIWFLVLLKLLIPYSPESHLSVLNIFSAVGQQVGIEEQFYIKSSDITGLNYEQEEHTKESLAIAESNISPDDKATVSDTAKPQSSSIPSFEDISPSLLTFLIWAAGVMLMGALVLRRDISFWLRIRKCKSIEGQGINSILAECRDILGIKAQITPIVTDVISFPSIYGIARPKLLLSESTYEKLNTDELRYIVLHELSHIKRKDIMVNCLLTLLKVVHWFNPIIRYGFNIMKYDMEVACDAMALSHVEKEQYKDYGLTMIGLMKGIKRKPVEITAAAGIMSKKSHIKGRIKMISIFKKNSYRWTALAIAVIFAVGAVGLTIPVKANEVPVKAAAQDNMGKLLEFKDKELEKSIALALGKAEGSTIYEEDVKKLKELKIEAVESLEGIEYCTNLEKIDFVACPVKDIALLSKLKKLKEFNMVISRGMVDYSPLKGIQTLEAVSFDNVQDLNFISGLKNLKFLTIDNIKDTVSSLDALKTCEKLEKLEIHSIGKNVKNINVVSYLKNLKNIHIGLAGYKVDISHLKDIKSIETIRLMNCEAIDDISVMAALINLKTLQLDSPNISDLTPISKMKNLTGIHISKSKIKSVRPIAELKNLEHLSLDDNQITDISSLSGLINLKSLSLNKNHIADIKSIASMKNLKYVYLAKNDIKNISYISSLHELEGTGLSSNNISDLKPLAGLTNLERILLDKNDITRIDSLSGLKKLKHLSLEENKIKDLMPLSKIASLETLSLNSNGIVDIRPLKSLINLQNLDLSTNNIDEIGAVSEMKELEYLNLESNRVQDIAPLANLKKLRVLDICSNKISDIEPLKSLDNLLNLSANKNEISDLSPLKSLTHLLDLELAENSISDISPLSRLKDLYRLHLKGNKIKDYNPISSQYNKLTEKDFELAAGLIKN